MPTLPSLLSPEMYIFLSSFNSGLNLTIPVTNLSLYAFPFKGRSRTAKRACWLPVDALHFQALMAHAHLQSLFLESSVLSLSPGCSPFVKLLYRIPVTVLLGTKTVGIDRSVSKQDMSVRVIPSRISIFTDMEGHDGTHP